MRQAWFFLLIAAQLHADQIGSGVATQTLSPDLRRNPKAFMFLLGLQQKGMIGGNSGVCVDYDPTQGKLSIALESDPYETGDATSQMQNPETQRKIKNTQALLEQLSLVFPHPSLRVRGFADGQLNTRPEYSNCSYQKKHDDLGVAYASLPEEVRKSIERNDCLGLTRAQNFSSVVFPNVWKPAGKAVGSYDGISSPRAEIARTQPNSRYLQNCPTRRKVVLDMKFNPDADPSSGDGEWIPGLVTEYQEFLKVRHDCEKLQTTPPGYMPPRASRFRVGSSGYRNLTQDRSTDGPSAWRRTERCINDFVTHLEKKEGYPQGESTKENSARSGCRSQEARYWIAQVASRIFHDYQGDRLDYGAPGRYLYSQHWTAEERAKEAEDQVFKAGYTDLREGRNNTSAAQSARDLLRRMLGFKLNELNNKRSIVETPEGQIETNERGPIGRSISTSDSRPSGTVLDCLQGAATKPNWDAATPTDGEAVIVAGRIIRELTGEKPCQNCNPNPSLSGRPNSAIDPQALVDATACTQKGKYPALPRDDESDPACYKGQ